jgi:hypothetical protein
MICTRRRRRERGEAPDVYTYESIPSELRVQIVHIWDDALGNPIYSNPNGNVSRLYQHLVQILRREYGVFALGSSTYDEPYDELRKFFLDTNDVDKTLDVIELTFVAVDRVTRTFDHLYKQDASKIADNAIDELNRRFKEHGVGYFYSDSIIGRIDSELVHTEVVKPLLTVLRQKEYANAQSEFLAAHEHYRQGNNSEALIECYKAFESTMKIICTKRKWPFDDTKGAAHLVNVCLDNGLIPPYWQSHFAGLRSVLTSAIPTPRNKQAGHGAGAEPVSAPTDELTAYVLHMTAATILFLTEAERKLS